MWIYVVLETWSVFGVEILSGSFCDLSPWTWTFLGVFFLDPEMWTGTAYVPYAGSGPCLLWEWKGVHSFQSKHDLPAASFTP